MVYRGIIKRGNYIVRWFHAVITELFARYCKVSESTDSVHITDENVNMMRISFSLLYVDFNSSGPFEG